jgi:predicted MFS family arabinose efflux permease
MAVNFIGPLLMLSGIASLVGIIFGLVKKDKKITKISLIAFVIIALIFIVLEGFFME